MATPKLTLKVVCIGSVVSFFVTIALILTQQNPRKPRCLSSRGCDIDFSSKVRSKVSWEPENPVDRKLQSHSQQSLSEKDLAELEGVYKEEIKKMEKQLKSLKQALDDSMISDDQKLDRNNCSSLVVKDRKVRGCISGDVIGRIPRGMKTRPFQVFKGGSPEDTKNRKDSFRNVFKSKAWGRDWDPNYKGLAASGMGATLFWTQEAMATLHIVISDIKRELGIKRVKILDVPCGDMAWMSRFLQTRDDIDYTGIDIVPELIKNHQDIFKYFPWKFETRDIVTNPINESYHLVLSRTLLQHLYYHDAMSVLKQFSDSGSHFLLTTSWSRHDKNEELWMEAGNPGRMRRLNLELPPISLPPAQCIQRDGPPNAIEGWDHFLGLWSLPLQQTTECEDIQGANLPGTEIMLYSCMDWPIKT